MRTQLSDGRVTIRAYDQRDAPALLEATLESVAELRPFMPWAHAAYSLEEAEHWMSICLDNWARAYEYQFGMYAVASGAYLGSCGLSSISTENRFANLGYWVRTSCTGQGVATAATRLLARLGFEDLGLERIEIFMSVENLASRRVAEKAGATFEGTLRRRLRLHARQHDAHMFSLVR